MEALTPALEVSKCICDPICRQIRYLNDLKKNFEILNGRVEELQAKVEDVKGEISGKNATRECEYWLKEAEKIQNKWKEIEEEYKKNKTCLGGWCPVSYSRLKLSKRIATLISEAAQILTDADFKGGFLRNYPQQIMAMSNPEVLEGNTSADQTLQDLLVMIKDASINRIGVWGMGGVGKTTIMKLLHNRPEIIRLFEIVLWVTVSKEGTNRNVREELAKRLKVQREDGESEESLKSKVFTSLRAKKFLLLLDDVWDMVDLQEVGVPLPNEGKIGCKVVLSTRYHRVCKKMGTDGEIKVKTLSENEAWLLFQKTVGAVADDPNIEPLAREVANECCGLPLAVVVIGGALRNVQGIYRWRCAVKELRSSVSAIEIEDIEEKVFRRLQYSYDWLKDESLKKCFLYCALFPEDHEIPKTELVQYWINEGLIDGSSDLQYAHDKGLSKLDELLEACLLEKVDYTLGRDRVKMHDVMRDLALRISSTEGEGGYSWSLVKAGVKLSEAPKAEDWKKTERISLMSNHLMTLPQMMPNCLMLTALLLQNNYKLEEIPHNFFVHMPALQVLDLSRTGINFLPQSIGNLANLRGLYLNDCQNLKVIPSEVRDLAKLEIFQIAGKNTKICYLPLEIEDLVSLKHFEVCCRPSSNTNQGQEVMKMFPRMSKLSKLERLLIHITEFGNYEWQDEFFSEGFINDVSLLQNLTHLMLQVLKTEHLEHFVQQSSSWKQLTNFRLHVYQKDLCQPESGMTLAFNGWDEIWLQLDVRFRILDYPKRVLLYNDCTGKAIPDEILTRVDSLIIEDSATVQCVSKFGCGKMKELKYCQVHNCKYIETIMQTTDDLLPSLMGLYLYNLCNLKSILEGPLQGNCCFPNLKSLYLIDCPKLKRVFSVSLLAHLPHLVYLLVENCQEVKEIISMEVEEDGGEEMVSNIQKLLPRLWQLDLKKLPQLSCIHNNNELSVAASWPSLRYISIFNCDKLKCLPHSFSKAPCLERIACSVDWWEALEWEDDAFKQQLCPKVTKHVAAASAIAK